ncbi:MAG: hypothetical protein VX278_08415 [Myxococcota bacterium]|nr:hypothetical protein [Myxococcota bacterium]
MKKIIPLVLLGITQLQCSPYFEDCSVGIFPFSGQSAVEVNTEIHFYMRYISEEQPGFVEPPMLQEAENGAVVESDIFVDIENAKIILTPREPLKEGTKYIASGAEFFESHHYSELIFSSTTDPYPGESTFTTTSRPSILGHNVLFDEERIAFLLSEPVLNEDLSQWSTSSDEIVPGSFTFLEVDDDYPHIVYYSFRAATSSPYLETMIVTGAGLRAEGSTEEPEEFSTESWLTAIPDFRGGPLCNYGY